MSQRITEESIIHRNPRMVFRATNDAGVLLHLDTGAYHGLNRLGRMIWESIGDGRSVVSIGDEIAAQFEEDPQTVRRDVNDFLQALAERDAIRAL